MIVSLNRKFGLELHCCAASADRCFGNSNAQGRLGSADGQKPSALLVFWLRCGLKRGRFIIGGCLTGWFVYSRPVRCGQSRAAAILLPGRTENPDFAQDAPEFAGRLKTADLHSGSSSALRVGLRWPLKGCASGPGCTLNDVSEPIPANAPP
jgi:hypothetical protein